MGAAGAITIAEKVRASRLGSGLQLLLLGSIALLGLVPPADGNILVVPLRSTHPESILLWALPAGALAMGAGALPGSYVVRGSRAALIWPAMAHGALLLSAQPTGCLA